MGARGPSPAISLGSFYGSDISLEEAAIDIWLGHRSRRISVPVTLAPSCTTTAQRLEARDLARSEGHAVWAPAPVRSGLFASILGPSTHAATVAPKPADHPAGIRWNIQSSWRADGRAGPSERAAVELCIAHLALSQPAAAALYRHLDHGHRHATGLNRSDWQNAARTIPVRRRCT